MHVPLNDDNACPQEPPHWYERIGPGFTFSVTPELLLQILSPEDRSSGPFWTVTLSPEAVMVTTQLLAASPDPVRNIGGSGVPPPQPVPQLAMFELRGVADSVKL